MWKLVLFALLACLLDCKAENSLFPSIESRLDDLPKNSPIARMNLESRSNGNAIRKAASNVLNSRNIDEMIQRMDSFPKKIPAELLNEKSMKPFVRKFKGDLQKIVAKAKPILEKVKKMEKSGKKKSKKQLAALKSELTNLTKQIQRFTKLVDSESKKQRNRNLRMVNNHPNDVTVLGDAKRCFSVIDIIADAVKMIQSIPGKISCFIFGNCESNGDDDSDSEENYPDNTTKL